MKVALVPGHRADAPGAGDAGLYEFGILPTLCKMIRDRVEVPDAHGLEILQRPNRDGGLVEVVREVNDRFDAVVSLHFNSTPKGVEPPDKAYLIVYPGSDEAVTFGAPIQQDVQLPGIEREGMHFRDDLAILRDTTVPAVLDEVCYLNREDHRETLLRNLGLLAVQYAGAIERMCGRAGS